MRKLQSRLVGPDVLKIVATIYVIFIHHKIQTTARFSLQHTIMLILWALLALAISYGIYRYGKKHNFSKQQMFWFCATPILFVLSLILLRKFAVTFFFIVSGYMLTSSLQKIEDPLKFWYMRENLVPRILRFYLTLLPIYVVGILIQVCFKGFSYRFTTLLYKFMLGGFTPGSYYVFAMAQFMLVFPLLYLLVKKFKGKGVVAVILFTLLWDVFATICIDFSETWYKYLILRLLPHVTLGIYAKLTDLKSDWFLNYCMFLIGIVYIGLFTFSRRVGTDIFYQWRSASVCIAIFMYPIIVEFLKRMQNVKYAENKFCYAMVNFSNATYHIFLFQMLYFRMIGYQFNYWVDNIIITMPINMVICLGGGILFYKWFAPLENKIIAYVKQRITPKNRRNESITAPKELN